MKKEIFLKRVKSFKQEREEFIEKFRTHEEAKKIVEYVRNIMEESDNIEQVATIQYLFGMINGSNDISNNFFSLCGDELRRKLISEGLIEF
jgi:hypothetical protein